MSRSTARPLLLISGLLLSGCSNLLVSSDCPVPVFPACQTIQHAAKPDTPDSLWQDLAAMTRVMLKLREREPKDEREIFGTCRLAELDQPAKPVP